MKSVGALFVALLFAATACLAEASSPDLWIHTVQAPTFGSIGANLPVTATLENIGNKDVGVLFTNRFYLSTDQTINGNDIFLGDAQESSVASGAVKVVRASLLVPSSVVSGTYYVGVIADVNGQVTDSNRANNVAAASSTTGLGTGGVPDLVPTILSNPLTIPAGAAFVVREQVINRGARQADQGWVSRWVVCSTSVTSSSPTSGATLLSDFANEILQAGSRLVVDRSLTMPTSLAAGVYRLGLIVDPDFQVTEQNESNNVTVSGAITVSALTNGPDLAIVDTPVVVPSTLPAGGHGTITFTVKNLGGRIAPGPFSAGVYLCPTTDIRVGGLFLGSVNVPSIAAGGTSAAVTAPFQVPPSVTRGLYYIGVIADITGFVADTNTKNNASPAVSLGVESAQSIADLVALTASGPALAQKGASATFTARVANNGGASLGYPFYTRFFLRSAQNVLTTLGTAQAPALAAFSSTQVQLTATIPTGLVDDSYTLRVVVDPDSQYEEANESNNLVESSQTISIVSPQHVANLVMSDVTVNTTVMIGSTTLVTGVIKNTGDSPTTNGFTNQLLLSRNATVTASDTLLATFSSLAISAGGSIAFGQTVQIPSSLLPGIFYVGAIANSPVTIAEKRTDDNMASARVSLVRGPDLVVNSLRFSPTTLDPDGIVAFDTSIRNSGGAAVTTPPERLVNRYYLGRSRPVTIADIMLGSGSIPITGGIPINGTAASSVSISLPPGIRSGAYFVGVQIDALGEISEERKDNNFYTSSTPLVIQGGPSLLAESLAVPNSVRGGANLPVSLTVRNLGRYSLTVPLEVGFTFLQVNGQNTAHSLGINTLDAAGLLSGQARIFMPSVPVPTTVPQGFYRLQAVLDPRNLIPEQDESETNHTITAPTTPSAIGVNQTGAGGPTVDLYYDPANTHPLTSVPLKITALFTRPVSEPTLAIDTPGTRALLPTAMTGGGTTWYYDYRIPVDNGRFDRDGVCTVRVEGGLDVDGLPNMPATVNNTFTVDTLPPVLTVTGLKDGDVTSVTPTFTIQVSDSSSVNLTVRGGNPDPLLATVSPTGSYTVNKGQFTLPNDTTVLTFSGVDEAGNLSSSLSMSLQRDSDEDGMPDDWERLNGLNPFDARDAAYVPWAFYPTLTYRDAFLLGLNPDPSSPPANDPRLLVPSGSVPARKSVLPGLLQLSVAVTSSGSGGPIGYRWTQVSGPAVLLSGTDTATPTFAGKKGGQYDFSVVLSNASGRSFPVIQTLDVLEVAPKAQVAAGSTVLAGDEVLLDGSGSSDANGDVLTYDWRADSGNPASLTRLTNGARSIFIPQVAGRHRFFLKVRDSSGKESPEVDVSFMASDPDSGLVPPTADSGVNQTVVTGVVVFLDGSSSTPGGSNSGLTYRWCQHSGPAVSLVGRDTAKPMFSAVSPGVYDFGLVVTNTSDDHLASNESRVRVVATQKSTGYPTANAGSDQLRIVREHISLDGSGSRSAGAGPLTYTWSQEEGPLTTPALENVPKPAFTPVDPGDYMFSLVVGDNGLESPPDQVLVRVLSSSSDQLPVANPTLLGQPLRMSEYRVILPQSGGTTVSLDGRSSFDPQGRPLAYRWLQTGGPSVAIRPLEGSLPTFVATAPGVHAFTLTVCNGISQVTEPLEIIVDSQSSTVPRATIEALAHDQTHTGQETTLNGNSPTPLPASIREYRWVQTAGPIVALRGANTTSPVFTPSDTGVYSFDLFVIDNGLRSPAASYTFTVVQGSTNPGSDNTNGNANSNTNTNGNGNDSSGRSVGKLGTGGGGGCQVATPGGSIDTGLLMVILTPIVVTLVRFGKRALRGRANRVFVNECAQIREP